MEHPGFFQKAGPFSLSEIARELGLDAPKLGDEAGAAKIIDVKALDQAGRGHITYFDDKKYLKTFKETQAEVCICQEKYQQQAPAGTRVLVSENPQESFINLLKLFYPESMRTQTSRTTGAMIDPSAQIEEGVEIEPGVIIGKEAQIGRGSRLAAGSVIGYRCTIGRDCYVGPNAVITHALIGNDVIIHAGVCLGQDGFGYKMGAEGHKKVPQIGRVILQDKVEVGANSTIDRGALGDTIIGEGSKIDNLVQIGHNVVMGCHAVIVSQAGLSGSTKLGNFVVMGGQTGTVGHIEIGDAAQIAASSKVNKDVPPNVQYGGTPAKPIKKWFKEIVAVEKLAEGKIKHMNRK